MDGPAPTVFHRSVGYHAPALRRLAMVGGLGVAAGALAAPFVRWQLAVLAGWDGAALAFVGSVWLTLGRAGPTRTEEYATRDDIGRETARLLLLAAAAASLASVVFALHLAGLETGSERAVLVTVAAFTVAVSWTVLNTVFTLRYAEDYYRSPPGAIDFGGASPLDRPDYRDFAYVAFTIGMTYQVSDTNLRNRRIRRSVLMHAVLSYLFGVIIVASAVSIVAGLVA
jgi:uncharacterized membrane protein